MATAFIAREIFTGHEIQTGKAVLVHEDRIVDIVTVPDIPAGYRQETLDGYMLAPAFMDLQIYGGNGKLFSTELTADALQATYEYSLLGGCTQFLITMATNSIEKLIRGMEVVKDYQAGGGKGVLGVHLEGPYISAAKKGAHIAKFMSKRPVPGEIHQLLEKGKGIAYDDPCTRRMRSRIASICCCNTGSWSPRGTAMASYQQAIDGFYQGISAATHLF